jgi:hypothetical protein
LEVGGALDRLDPVVRLTDDLEIRFLGQDEFEPAPEQRVVVDDQDTNRRVVRGTDDRRQPETSISPSAPSLRL